MEGAGYSSQDAYAIKGEVEHFSKMRQEISLASGDEVDMKQYEPAMRQLLDAYIKASDSEQVIDFQKLGLIELIVEKAKLNPPSNSGKKVPEAMAETIENNIRKAIINGQPINPAYYDKMSELLDALIEQRREEAIEYSEYLEKVKQLAESVSGTGAKPVDYPDTMDTRAKQSLYDNLDQNEDMVARIDAAIRYTKKDNWKANNFKRREVENAVKEELGTYEVGIDELMNIIKSQAEYD
jgi:type I restriction enzyme R subunit